MINPEVFLDKEKAGLYLSKNSQKIFGRDLEIKIVKIKRSYTYNPDNFNILIDIESDKENRIRISTSKIKSKKGDFQILNYFYENGFDKGDFQVSRPLAFLEQDNVLIYQDIIGSPLSKLFNNIELDDKIAQSAKFLSKVHGLKKGSLPLQSGDFLYRDYNKEEIGKYYPNLSTNLGKIIDSIKNRVEVNSFFKLCHGDFNPNNLIFNSEVFLIDFSSTCYYTHELDLASFLSHLQIMLGKINKEEGFENLKQLFLKQYLNNNSYDEEKLNLLMVLIDLRLLEIAIIYKWSDYNEQSIPMIYEIVDNDIKKASINVDIGETS